ncbi:MAG: hypothetical protein ACXIU7_07485 [Roseinatronobacter sp.]
MSAGEAPVKAAQRFLAIYAEDACTNGARLWTYTEVAIALGWAPARARNIMPLLNAIRDLCAAKGLPDLRTVIVAAGTDLPSRKSFHLPHGTWAETTLDRAGVRRVQARLLALDWRSI